MSDVQKRQKKILKKIVKKIHQHTDWQVRLVGKINKLCFYIENTGFVFITPFVNNDDTLEVKCFSIKYEEISLLSDFYNIPFYNFDEQVSKKWYCQKFLLLLKVYFRAIEFFLKMTTVKMIGFKKTCAQDKIMQAEFLEFPKKICLDKDTLKIDDLIIEFGSSKLKLSHSSVILPKHYRKITFAKMLHDPVQLFKIIIMQVLHEIQILSSLLQLWQHKQSSPLKRKNVK